MTTPERNLMTDNPRRRNPVRPAVLDGTAARIAAHPHITTSSEFTEFLKQHRLEAQRRKDDIVTEITRLEAEIQSRMRDVDHEDEIIARADAALTIEIPATHVIPNRPAPALTEHKEGETADDA
jgi:hypothetical protein